MKMRQSERIVRDVESRDLSRNSDRRTSILANAIFAKGRDKRVGVVLLGAAFVVGVAAFPTAGLESAVAQESSAVLNVEDAQDPKNAFLYVKDGGGYKITGVRDRDATTLVIPSKIDGVFVRKIGEGAFKGLKRLETLSWPSAEGPCEMEPAAFEFCSALKKVELPENLEAVPERAFRGCVALETVLGGAKVRKIGEQAFLGCKSLETLKFNEVASIGMGAFAGCKLLPNFDMVSQKGNSFQVIEGLLLSKDGETLCACPPGRTGEVVVPEGVRLIAKGAFQGGEVETVVLPQTLEIIDAEAFASCRKLKSVLGAPEALEIVGDSAFANCSSLERFDWPKNLQVIGKSAFSHCGLTSAEIKSVRRIGEYAFQYCGKLTTLSAPSETREIEAGAFFGTKLTTFKIPRDLETLQAGALDCLSLEKIEIEEGNKAFKIVDGALLSADGKTLYRVDATAKGPTWKIPDGVRVVSRSAFRGNKAFVSLEIPEGVETIGKGAFYACSALEKLKIPASLRELDDEFSLCSPNLTFEVAEGNPTYKSVNGSLLSADGKTLYRVGGNWEKKVLVLPEGVERLATGSCRGKQTFVKIPSTVKRIDSGAFSGCDEMTGIVIPASVERLDERFISSKITTFEVAPENPNYKSVDGALLSKDGKTFYRLVAQKLSAKERNFRTPDEEKRGFEFVVPEGVETIAKDAFINNRDFTKIVFPQSLKKIEEYAIDGPAYLQSVVIPAGVTTIEPNAFARCFNLSEVVLESSEARFSPEAFAPAYSNRPEPLIRVDEKAIAKEAADRAAREAVEGAFEREEGTGLAREAILTGVRDRDITTLQIPETLDGLPVKTIANGAFSGLTSLKTVRIPATLETIGARAFEGCAALEKIEFIEPEKTRLRKIDDTAFKGCSSLTTFEAPDSLYDVGAWAFAECSALETVKFGKSLLSIQNYAFRDCASLRSVEFSDEDVELLSGSAPWTSHIAYQAFAGCDALLEFNAPKSLASIHHETFGRFGSRKTPIKFNLHPENAFLKNDNGLISKADGKIVYAYFGDGSGELVLPEGLESLGMIFQYAPITSVRLPKSLKQIGLQAFRLCEKLERVEIPEDSALERIDSSAFYGCKALKTVDWPKSLKNIGDGAFAQCEALESFVGATGVETIGNSAFCDCKSLKTVELSNGLRKIGGSAFVDCKSLKTVELPNGLIEIGASAFAETGLESIKIPASVNVLGDAALAITPLKTIEVEEGNPSLKVVDGALLSLDGKTLWRLPPALKLTLYKVPDGVQTIERAALGGNATLEEIELPESLTTIKHNAFYRCSPLKKIRIPAKVVDLNIAAFTLCDSLESFEVAPENPKYKSENGALLSKNGQTFYKIVAVERDPSAAPYVLEPLEDGEEPREIPAYKNPVYRVPDGVVEIGPNAFFDERRTRNAFTEIVLPESVRKIGSTAFKDCSRLETARISANVVDIAAGAFNRCYALKTFELDEANSTFRFVDGMLLTKDGKMVWDIVLDQKRDVWKVPEGVEKLVSAWIPARHNVSEIVLPQSLKTIGTGGLNSSANLTQITIPENVEEIFPGAFHYCPKLTKIVIKSEKTKFTDAAFYPSVVDMPSYIPQTPRNLEICVEASGDASQTPEEPQASETAQKAEAVSGDVGTTYEEASKAFDVRIVDGEATIYGVRSKETTLRIPEKIDGALVTKIAENAFANNIVVKEIVWPSSLREIGKYAFKNCASLEKISPLTAHMDNGCFAVGQFDGCGSLRAFEVDPNSPHFTAVDGVLFNKDGTSLYRYPLGRTDELYQVPDGVKAISSAAFAQNQYIKTVKFPWTLESICEGAFRNCGALESAQFFPVVNSLRIIREDAFNGCDALKSIRLPDGIREIGSWAFRCASLETVEFYPVTIDAKEALESAPSPQKVAGASEQAPGMTFQSNAFWSPKLKAFELPETLVSLGQTAIRNDGSNRLVDEQRTDRLALKLPRSLETFSGASFGGVVNLGDFEVDPENERVKTVDGALVSKDGKTFYRCPNGKIGEYDVPDGVETLKTFSLSCERLSKIRTPKTLRKIENYVFDGCRNLETLEIAEGVVEMGVGFQNCTKLKTIKLPSTLRNDAIFSEESFAYYCPELETIEIAPESPYFKNVDGAVLSKDGKTLYWVPGRKTLTEYVVPDGVETIVARAFYGREALTTVRFPKSLKTIEADAFRSCHLLTQVAIPAGVVSIDPTAFDVCLALQTIEVDAENKTFKIVDGALVNQSGETIWKPARPRSQQNK